MTGKGGSCAGMLMLKHLRTARGFFSMAAYFCVEDAGELDWLDVSPLCIPWHDPPCERRT
jgi:hypothetical protein